MTDIDIVGLLWIRDELALEQLEHNYGRYCRQISWEIVQNREDVGACLNDTWWKTWCSIPENKPDSLRAYVARITRNLSLNKVIHNQAWKRGYGKISTIEKEAGDLKDCVQYAISDEKAFSRLLGAVRVATSKEIPR